MNIEKDTLGNGLESVVVPMTDTPTVTVMVMVNAGSRHETKNQNGISHFLEHMFFKGTENRPTSYEVSRDLDQLGAESNAFTGHEYTAYYGKSQSEKASRIIGILADIYQNSLLPESEIEKEAGVISEEIRMYNDLPMQLVHDLFQSHVFPNHPIGRSILGKTEAVKGFTQKDLLRYRQNHYSTDNSVVVTVGNVDPTDIQEDITNQFSSMEDTNVPATEGVTFDPESRLAFRKKDCDQTHLIVGGRGAERDSDTQPALELLSTVLGRGMSSRLFRKLRGEMGVCYYVRSKADYFTDTGLFRISTGVAPDRLTEVVGQITKTLRKVAKEGVKKAEIRKAKEFTVGNYLLGREASDSIARDVAKQSVLDSSIEKPSDYTQKIRNTSPQEIKQVAQNVIENGLYAAAIGPDCDKPAVEQSLK
jgi:predicted Zn-dependent peptidase